MKGRYRMDEEAGIEENLKKRGSGSPPRPSWNGGNPKGGGIKAAGSGDGVYHSAGFFKKGYRG